METHYQYFINAASNFLTYIGAISLAVLPGITSFIGYSLRKNYRLIWLLIIPVIFYISIFFLVISAYSKLLQHLAENRCRVFIEYWLNYWCSKSFEWVIWYSLFGTTLILVIIMLIIFLMGAKE